MGTRVNNPKVAVISDGRFRLDGVLFFGQVPRVLWQERNRPDRQNRIAVTANCLLIKSAQGNVLVDTGLGTKRREFMRDRYGAGARKLIHNLRDHNLSARDIDYVILSHLHFDHAGGSTKLDRNGQPMPTFPRARYLVQQKALDQAINPNERARASFFTDDFLPLKDRGQIDVLNGDTEVIPGVRVRVTGGHTPGHQIVLADLGGERIAYCGDLVPTSSNISLPWIGANDTYPEETLERKRELLEEAERNGWLLVFSHDSINPSGYLERRNGRLKLRPVTL